MPASPEAIRGAKVKLLEAVTPGRTMRELIIEVPRGRGEEVLQAAREAEGVNLARLQGEGVEGAVDVVLVRVPNGCVEGLLERLGGLESLCVTLRPHGVITLHPPEDQAADQATNVGSLSPVEVFLSGLQSVGSWKGFLGYALASGLVAWTGFFTNTVYLLVAAMLIAPFAGPAMTLAIGSARGDGSLMLRSLARYFAGLAVSILTAAALTLLMRQDVATSLMVSVSNLSTATLVLPLAAGFAGAVHLFQSERDSLVSGAGVGILVAASLAPPSALVGMAAALGKWEMVESAAFVLLLQLVGINLAAAVTMRVYGMRPQGPRYKRGRKGLVAVAAALTVIALTGLLAYQFLDTPDLQRATLEERAVADARRAVADSGLAEVVHVEARFTRADIPGQETLLVSVYVQPFPEVAASDAEVRERLARAVGMRIQEGSEGVTPVVDITVVHPPERA